MEFEEFSMQERFHGLDLYIRLCAFVSRRMEDEFFSPCYTRCFASRIKD